MLSLRIVELEVDFEPGDHGGDRRVVVQINVLILHAAPEPLYEDIVQGPATAVHADLDALGFQTARELDACELAALVGIENLRPAKEADRFVQSL